MPVLMRRWCVLLKIPPLLAAGLCVLLTARLIVWQMHHQHLQHCLTEGETTLAVAIVGQTGSGPRPSWRAQILTPPPNTCAAVSGQMVRLTATPYSPVPDLRRGDRVVLKVRLRRLHGTHNFGVFDYQRWQQGQGYIAVAAVQSVLETLERSPVPKVQDPQALLYLPLIKALALGDRSSVTAEHWALFRDTGTVHLFVVSGFHVGIVAGALFGALLLALRAWACVLPETLLARSGSVSFRQVSALGALLAVWWLAWVTGMQPPVVRASVMASMGVLVWLMDRTATNWRRLVVFAAFGALLWRPANFYNTGFWLSHIAVFLLLLVVGEWQRPTSAVGVLVRTQGALVLLLAPWLVGLQGQVSTLSVLANLLVVPVMSLVGIPAAVLGYPIHQFSGLDTVLVCADYALHLVLRTLHVLVQTADAIQWPGTVRLSASGEFVALAAMGVVVLWKPLPFRARVIGVLAGLLLGVPTYSMLPAGHFRLEMLDVGQGNSALLATRDHLLLIDTGPAFPGGFNVARDLLQPVLARYRQADFDAVLLTHLDLDHAGGIDWLREHRLVRRTYGWEQCEREHTWQWNGVEFQLLQNRSGVNANDRSCLLVARAQNGAVAFFAGDISYRSEQKLHPQLPQAVDVLQVPHHGSGSSSSWGFVRRVQPRWAVHSASKYNTYGHPQPSILARYAGVGSHNIITSKHGAVRWDSRYRHAIYLSRFGDWPVQSAP